MKDFDYIVSFRDYKDSDNIPSVMLITSREDFEADVEALSEVPSDFAKLLHQRGIEELMEGVYEVTSIDDVKALLEEEAITVVDSDVERNTWLIQFDGSKVK